MKILHINRYAWRHGGAESYMFETRDRQRDDGDDAEIFGSVHPRNPSHRFQEHFPPYVDFRGESTTPTNRLRAAGRMVYSRRASRGLEAVLNQYRPDVAHLHGVYSEMPANILWTLKKARVPTVMTVHDYKLACPRQDLLRHGQLCMACDGHRFHKCVTNRCKNGSLGQSGALALEAYAHRLFKSYDWVALFLCPSEFMRSTITAQRIEPSRTMHCPNFVDVEQATMPDASGSSRNGVVYAGRLAESKGIDVLLRAAERLPEVPITIAGHGPMAADVQAAARTLPNLKILPHQSRDSVLQIMSSALVTVLPARWHENQPMSILESFAMRVPVIATTLGGLPELVIPGETGQLIPPDDVTALVAALEHATDNRDQYIRLGENARQRIEQRHSPAGHMKTLAQAYSYAAAQVDASGPCS